MIAVRVAVSGRTQTITPSHFRRFQAAEIRSRPAPPRGGGRGGGGRQTPAGSHFRRFQAAEIRSSPAPPWGRSSASSKVCADGLMADGLLAARDPVARPYFLCSGRG